MPELPVAQVGPSTGAKLSTARYGSLFERLVANTRQDSEQGCWIWTGSRMGNGGRPRFTMRVNGKHVNCNAAREMLKLFYADGDWEASHVCKDSRLCINPDHLLPETKQQNMDRRWGKDPRQGVDWPTVPEAITSFNFPQERLFP